MARFWSIKAVRTILTLWFVVTFAFVVLRLSGDPVQALLGPDATNDEIAHFTELWGLDRPLPEQYLAYAGRIAVGDFGVSYRDGREAVDLIGERVPWTLLLGITSYVLAILVGVPAGIIAALNRGRLIDRLIMSLAVFGFALPYFFSGILLILLFSLTLRWLPSSGTGGIEHLIMPALTLGLFHAGALARFTRSAMLDVLSKLYMRAAAAKGVPPARRILRHALPNAAIPVVTILGLNLGQLVAGAIIVEVVFAWPGVGRLLVTAVTSRDLAVVQALVLLIAATMIVANLVVDLLYGVLDPRIRAAR
ncbi:ABC transporter permease [Marinivivus vitaminiproducens]|uniref:ABC transporter permease n=1 Tax=Marinivivus vitaminiproducens TaxID=3035935 RepID=UPI00279E93C4|nr:ABC transporter permease [Geminicoccaceae bacterium SCSIO 64248]